MLLRHLCNDFDTSVIVYCIGLCFTDVLKMTLVQCVFLCKKKTKREKLKKNCHVTVLMPVEF